MVVDIEVFDSTLTRAEARALLGRTMGLVKVTIGAFALGVYLGSNMLANAGS